MSRISNSSFKVNSSLEQQIELSAVKGGVTVPISSGATLDVDVVANSVGLATDATVVANGVAQATAINQVTQNASLANIDTNTTGLASELTLGVVSTDLSNLDSKIGSGVDTTLITAQQVGIYGYDGSNWRQANVSNGGNLKVESELEDHAGSQGNLNNATAVVNGDTSAAIDTSNHTLLTIFGNSTGTDPVDIQVSADGITYYAVGFGIYPDANGDFYQSLANVCANNVRVKYTGTATVTATLLHNNH